VCARSPLEPPAQSGRRLPERKARGGHLHGSQGVCQVSMAHICSPSYSGGRDQEDHSSKSAQANSSQYPISKILNTKRAGRVAQGVECLPSKHEALSSNPSIVGGKKKGSDTMCTHLEDSPFRDRAPENITVLLST
jgi:hypothetical protein